MLSASLIAGPNISTSFANDTLELVARDIEEMFKDASGPIRFASELVVRELRGDAIVEEVGSETDDMKIEIQDEIVSALLDAYHASVAAVALGKIGGPCGAWQGVPVEVAGSWYGGAVETLVHLRMLLMSRYATLCAVAERLANEAMTGETASKAASRELN